MHFSSSCKCGAVTLSLQLTGPIEGFEPRACDCDFCQSNAIVYLSDPQGELCIECADDALASVRQGSEQAKFWRCARCEQVVAVTHSFDSGPKGAVNVRLFADRYELGEPSSVSPRLHSPEVERNSWRALWMNVSFDSVTAT